MMHRLLKTTILVLAILGNTYVWSQGNPEIPEVAPVSPNAASLGQYGEVPVDLYHGLPNISIPLYTVEMDGVQVPISLSFHAGGHKVRTIASWVGLGWTLNAGGAVTRSMRGRPDASGDTNGFFNTMALIEQWEVDGNLALLTDPDLDNPGFVQQTMQTLYENNWDTQADIFFYNYPGGSGKFMFKPDGSVMQIPYLDQNISFNAGDNTIPGISTADGMYASFGDVEISQFTGGPDYSRVYNSAYYLTSYGSSISGKEVTFHYKNGPALTDDIISQDVITERLVINPPRYSYTRDRSEPITTHFPRYLDTIRWESGHIEFLSTPTRLDQENALKLDAIIVYNVEGEEMKRFLFHYLPFGGSVGVHQSLILRAITEVGRDGEQKPPYVFDYYDLGLIPDRDSKAMDLFGFYNGAINNTTLIPEFLDLERFLPRSDADRTITKDAATVGMLRTIHYPTGGSSTFTYESNEYYSTQPGISPYTKSLGTTALAEACSSDGSLFYEESNYDDSEGIIGLQCQEDIESSIITIREDAFNMKLVMSHQHGRDVVINHNGSDEIFILDLIEIDNGTETVVASYSGLNTNHTDPDVLEAGKTYKLRARTNITGSLLRGTIAYQYEDIPEDGNANNYLGPGLRVARIENYDAAGNTTTKVYEYKMADNPGHSSGRLLAKSPSYAQERRAFELIPPDPRIWQNPDGTLDDKAPPPAPGWVHYRTMSAQPTNMLGFFGGDLLVYDEVVEREIGNGHTRYFYSYQPDGVAGNNLQELPGGLEFPNSDISLKQISSAFWKRGKLDSVQVYDEGGNLLRQTKNVYSFLETDESKTFHYELAVERKSDISFLFTNSFLYVFEKQRTGWTRLDSTINYVYEDGLKSVTRTFNSYDDRFPPPIIAPLETHSFLDGVNDSRTETTFLNDDILLPTNVRYFNAESQLLSENVYTYEGYNPTLIETYFGHNSDPDYTLKLTEYNGSKPSFIEPTNGVNMVYLWAYGNTRPIAKITNATYVEISDHLGDNLQALRDSYNNDEIKTILTGLRSSLTLTQSMMSYIHKEGVGLQEVIDDQGLSTYYRYDGLNRLLSIQDFEGNYLQYYEYNYGLNPFAQYQFDSNGFGDPLNGDNPNTSGDGSGGNSGGDTGDGDVDEPIEEGEGSGN